MESATFDYLIVGGGSAGCVLAARLSEDPGVTVALLEAGPVDKRPHPCATGHCLAGQKRPGQLGLFHRPQPGLNRRQGFRPRGKVLGGSSSINAMIYARGQAQDYDAWAAEGNPGWSFQDVLPYFLRAEDNARGASALHATGGPCMCKISPAPTHWPRGLSRPDGQREFPLNTDFNGATQEGVGMYQVTDKR